MGRIVYDSIYINSEKCKFVYTGRQQTSSHLGVGKWGGAGGRDYEEAEEDLGVMETLVTLIVVMVSQVCVCVDIIK